MATQLPPASRPSRCPAESDVAMPSDPRSPAGSSVRLPAGVLARDYLTFPQLSVDNELRGAELFDEAALEEAMIAIGRGSMHAARPAMKVFFDGCQLWLESL